MHPSAASSSLGGNASAFRPPPTLSLVLGEQTPTLSETSSSLLSTQNPAPTFALGPMQASYPMSLFPQGFSGLPPWFPDAQMAMRVSAAGATAVPHAQGVSPALPSATPIQISTHEQPSLVLQQPLWFGHGPFNHPAAAAAAAAAAVAAGFPGAAFPPLQSVPMPHGLPFPAGAVAGPGGMIFSPTALLAAGAAPSPHPPGLIPSEGDMTVAGAGMEAGQHIAPAAAAVVAAGGTSETVTGVRPVDDRGGGHGAPAAAHSPPQVGVVSSEEPRGRGKGAALPQMLRVPMPGSPGTVVGMAGMVSLSRQPHSAVGSSLVGPDGRHARRSGSGGTIAAVVMGVPHNELAATGTSMIGVTRQASGSTNKTLIKIPTSALAPNSHQSHSHPATAPSSNRGVKLSLGHSASARAPAMPGSRAYSKRQPIPEDYPTTEEYQIAWRRWRQQRDENNAAVRRCRGQAAGLTVPYECSQPRCRSGRQLVRSAATNADLLMRALWQADRLSERERGVLDVLRTHWLQMQKPEVAAALSAGALLQPAPGDEAAAEEAEAQPADGMQMHVSAVVTPGLTFGLPLSISLLGGVVNAPGAAVQMAVASGMHLPKVASASVPHIQQQQHQQQEQQQHQQQQQSEQHQSPLIDGVEDGEGVSDEGGGEGNDVEGCQHEQQMDGARDDEGHGHGHEATPNASPLVAASTHAHIPLRTHRGTSAFVSTATPRLALPATSSTPASVSVSHSPHQSVLPSTTTESRKRKAQLDHDEDSASEEFQIDERKEEESDYEAGHSSGSE